MMAINRNTVKDRNSVYKQDNCVVGSFCVLTFKVRELLTFVF